MRIGLFCACPFSYSGGVQEHVKALFDSLQKKGVYVKILLPGSNGGKEENINHYYFGSCVPLFSTDTRGNLSFCLNPDLIDEVLEREKFDILHFHSPDAPFLAWQFLERSKAVNIGTFHTSVEGTLFEEFFLPITQYFQKEIIKKIHGIIVVSNTARSYLPKDIHAPIVTIPNGVDLSRFSEKNAQIKKFKDGKINILFVGRFDRRKGVKYLLQAFKLLREKYENIRLILVGSGALSYWYKMRALAEDIPDVEFVGEVSDKELPCYYATCDIFCSPATHGESFGIVLLEAMATGKPVVAYANSGYKEVLISKGAQFLAPPRDISALAEKLEKLILNTNLRNEMGQWGLQEVKKYSWDSVSEQVLKFYEKILERAKRKF